MSTQLKSFSLPLSDTAAPEEVIEFPPSPLLRWTFYAFMFSIPFDVLMPSWLPASLKGDLSIPRIVGIILTIMFLLEKRLRPWKLPTAFAAFGMFVIIFAISMLRSGFDVFPVVFQQFQLFVLFVIAYNLFLTGQVIRGALLSFTISCGISSVLILTGATVDVYQVDIMGGRMSPFGANPNIYSQILMIGILVAIGLGHIRKGTVLYLPILWAFAIVTMIAVALSGSRGSTLALGVGIAIFILEKLGSEFRVRNFVFASLVTFTIFWTLSNTPILLERWDLFIAERNISGREIITLQALEMVKERPLIGWGPDATSILAVRLNYQHGLVRATHNMPLAMLTYNGILGALPYFCAYIAVILAAWRARSGMEKSLPLALFIAMFVTDMASGGLPDKLHWVLFAYILAANQLTEMAALAKAAKGLPSEATG